MTVNEFYSEPIAILDSYLTEGRSKVIDLREGEEWKEENILKFYKQSLRILYCLLSNTDKSKFANNELVIDINLVGTLGRTLRDIYVKILYLKSNEYCSEHMQVCWEYQVALHKKKLLSLCDNEKEFEIPEKFEQDFNRLKLKINTLKFDTKGQVCDGKEEKMISKKKLAELNGINDKKFDQEYSYFSQFTHSSAFSNSLIIEDRISLGILAETYRRIVAYVVGITVETWEIFSPNHTQLDEARSQYNDLKKNHWN